jgi:hypothetical protein
MSLLKIYSTVEMNICRVSDRFNSYFVFISEILLDFVMNGGRGQRQAPGGLNRTNSSEGSLLAAG